MLIFYIFLIVAVCVAIGFVAHKINKNIKYRGKLGERAVSAVLGKTKEGVQYLIDDYIVEKDGKSSQIDHILINQYGIFVIETKNYSGRIYGNDEQLEWTQVLQYGKVKNRFYNPIKQNATHVYKIKSIVGPYPVKSFVVFVQNNTQYINSLNVIPLRDLRHTVNQGTPTLNEMQMQEIYNKLESSRSSINQEQHIKNINQLQKDIQNNICPRCGSKLVKRHGKYGDFYGCSNYPKCKFTKHDK